MSIDISTEAVERLSVEAERLSLKEDMLAHDQQVAATLRALAAERDALNARADLTWFWTIVDRNGLTGLPSDEREALSRLVTAAAQRDAALGEVARLREALTLAANRLDRLTLLQPHGSARRYEVAEWTVETRVALAQEPRHD